MKTTILLIIPILCLVLNSCSSNPAERMDVKFSVFSTEYGASVDYSKKGGLELGLDTTVLKGAIDRRSGK